MVNYIIVGCQRSGSSLLCHLMGANKVGTPGEYFLHKNHDGVTGKFKEFTDRGKTSDDYVDYVKRTYATTGHVGIKMFLPAVCDIVAYSTPPKPGRYSMAFKRYFPDFRFIWIVRRNLLRQAISTIRMNCSGVFSESVSGVKHKNVGTNYPIPRGPELHKHIVPLLVSLVRQTEEWERVFSELGVTPIKVYYEDFVLDMKGGLERIFYELGVSVPNINAGPPIKKQADGLTEEMVNEELRAMPLFYCNTIGGSWRNHYVGRISDCML